MEFVGEELVDVIVGIIELDPDTVDVDRILAPAENDLAFLFEGSVKAVIEMLDLFLHDLIVKVVHSSNLENGV
jgi:hypothetical protein